MPRQRNPVRSARVCAPLRAKASASELASAPSSSLYRPCHTRPHDLRASRRARCCHSSTGPRARFFLGPWTRQLHIETAHLPSRALSSRRYRAAAPSEVRTRRLPGTRRPRHIFSATFAATNSQRQPRRCRSSMLRLCETL
ncbi:hypothetical protein PsYK624_154270 [Phanerochaete sordida]|uniref:Uncharacterized protein n=1 Tax=Phanerochaete sordida TaxID=48140 RepID=A0A9P3GRT3_9APHY|nr:hypothetical protein PsYK624_154270 [Phanerochaete sordida]